MYEIVTIDGVDPVHIGPGCRRYDLPSSPGSRAWIVDIDAGAQWPHVDHHGASGEMVLVLSGSVIEDEQVIGAGQYVRYGADSSHRPRSEEGVRLFGVNLTD